MTSAMSEVPADGKLPGKLEKDYAQIVDALVPETEALAKAGKRTDALDKLLAVEKQTRVGADLASNTRVLLHILQLCFRAQDWKNVNEHIILLSKKNGILKQAITRMVQEAMSYVDKTPNQETKLELIQTLRTVTEGKIFVEVERARVTRLLAKIREDEGKVTEACDILQELQVETFGSMEKREKTEFILEQMRLCLLKKDYPRVQIVSKKINIKYFDHVENQDLKLKFYELMIQYALQQGQFLDICRYYMQVYATPCVKEDGAKLQDALKHAVLFVVLSASDPEQTTLLHKLQADENLAKIPLHASLLACFLTQELMRWAAMEEMFGKVLRESSAFQLATEAGAERYKVLKSRVVEHNVRVISKYYTRLSMGRLVQLLDLPAAEVETVISNLVVNKSIYARMDRTTGIVSFAKPKDVNTVLGEWSSGIHSLLDMLVKTEHLIAKEEMVHTITKVL